MAEIDCGSGGRCTVAHEAGREFFTSARRDDGRAVPLSGPYQTHEQALQALDDDKQWAWDMDPRAPWYSYGTLSVTAGTITRTVRQ